MLWEGTKMFRVLLSLIGALLIGGLPASPVEAASLYPVKTAWEAHLATGGAVTLALSATARKGGTVDLALNGLTPRQSMKVTFFAGTCAKPGATIINLANLSSANPSYYGGYRLTATAFGLLTARLKKGSLSVRIGSAQRCGTFAKPVNCQARAMSAPFVWKLALLLYPNTAVTYRALDGSSVSLTSAMTPDEIGVVQSAAQNMATLASQWSDGAVQLEVSVLPIDHPLTALTKRDANPAVNSYAIAQTDITADLRALAPDGTYDSLIAVWKPWNEQGQAVPTDYWGLGTGPSADSDNSTFATLILGNAAVWGQPGLNGEVMMHEWLHGIVDYYHAMTGQAIPSPDDRAADGYEPLTIAAGGSQARFDHDILTAQVVNQATGEALGGITAAMWGSGSPRLRSSACYPHSY